MSRIADASVPSALTKAMHNNLHRTLYNNPEMADAFGVLARTVHTSSRVEHRIRELAILRIASQLGADVEWGQHFKIAQMVGVSADEGRDIRDDDLSSFTDKELVAIRFAEAVEKGQVSDSEWEEASRHYSAEQLLDLTLLAGFYGYASRITLAMGVAVDDGLQRIDES